jgi:hypothetical protein
MSDLYVKHRKLLYRIAYTTIILAVVIYLVGSHLWSAYDEVGLAWAFYSAGAVLQVTSLTIITKLDYDRRTGKLK